MSARVYFHIDINAFYASAHVILDPSLKGKPIAVCKDISGAIITTASYEARQFGVRSAMPLSEAKRLCPNLEVVPLDFSWYSELSEKFIELIKNVTTLVEQASIDECYADVTEVIKTYPKPLDLAVKIQRDMKEQLGLPISIGVAPNKFLAKMASDMKKPNGISVLRIREVEDKLWPMDINKMHGIGKKTVPKLQEIGVHTIGDLNRVSFDLLKSILGNRTQNFIDKANGYDYSQLDLDSQTKSIGQSRTFSSGLYEYDEFKRRIVLEIEEVERRLKKSELMGKTITLALRFEDFKTASRSITLNRYLNNKEDILEYVMMLFEEFDGEGGVTFISVTLSNLKPIDEIIEQMDLFNIDKTQSVSDIIDELNKHIDGKVFVKASAIVAKEGDES